MSTANRQDPAALRGRIDELPAEKRALLERLLQRPPAPPADVEIRPRGPHSALPPLSFSQKRLWFLDQLAPGDPFYNLPLALRLHGPLQCTALRRAVNEIIRRHEALRTVFTTADGRPRQVIAERVELDLPLVDLRDRAGPQREAEMLHRLNAAAMEPFDLGRLPLLRGGLLRMGADEHVLVLVMHHIVIDDWSLGLFFNELAALYEAFTRGAPSPLAELPVQYADFAVWQRDWMAGPYLHRELAFWKNQLAELPRLDLPVRCPGLRVASHRGVNLCATLSRAVHNALLALSQREGVTPFMTLLAAVQVLLMRYTAQEDIAVGSPIAGRSQRQTRDLIGFFLNTVVLRTDLSGDPTFRQLLSRVRRVSLGAYAHQDLPFERLVAELHPDRNAGHNPLFQVFFNFVDWSDVKVTLPPLRVEPVDHPALETAHFDLSVYFITMPEGLTVKLTYIAELFDEAVMGELLDCLLALLQSAAADPDRPIGSLPMVPDARRAELIAAFNQPVYWAVESATQDECDG